MNMSMYLHIGAKINTRRISQKLMRLVSQDLGGTQYGKDEGDENESREECFCECIFLCKSDF